MNYSVRILQFNLKNLFDIKGYNDFLHILRFKVIKDILNFYVNSEGIWLKFFRKIFSKVKIQAWKLQNIGNTLYKFGNF